jgi:phospholipase C
MKIVVSVKRRPLAVLSALAVSFGLAAAGSQANAAGTGSAITAGPDSQIPVTATPGTGTGPITGTTLAGSASTRFISTPIQHVVVIYMENHSFDNVLGYWCRRNRSRCKGADGAFAGMPASVTLSDGTVVTPSASPDVVPNVTHSMAAQLAAMHIVGGVPRMDGWQNITGRNGTCSATTGYQCITGYEPSQIPNLAALASAFAISDNTFSMGDSASWGGHLYAVLASLDGFTGDIPEPKGAGPGWGCNSNKVTTWVSPSGARKSIPSCVPDYALDPAKYPYGGAFKATPAKWEPSILDRLDTAGLSWKIYDGDKQPASDGWAICPSLADCWYTSQQKHMSTISQFNADAANGTLPNFSLIIPGGANNRYSQHNNLSMTAGDNWIGQLASAIMNGPNWSSTAVFITYDDCGCFYDQAVPGRNPDGTWQGPRSPLVIVSPYARPGYTDTTHTTFAGILAYVEHTFGLPPLGPNDQAAYDFSNAFNYAQQPLRPVKMVKRPLPASARHLHLTPAMLNDPT